MKRSESLVAAGIALGSALTLRAGAGAAATASPGPSVPNKGKPLAPPKSGLPRVAVLIGPDTVAIDAVGPWESFMNANKPDGRACFMLYTVSATLQPVSVEGLWVMPNYTFENVPQPDVVVIPAQRNLPASIAWVKAASAHTGVVMSVCTGARLLAKTGLLDGLAATTHHSYYDGFEKQFPKVTLIRGPRYVENPEISTAGGESSGIYLALRVVERYYGPQIAAESAYEMEHVRGPRPQSVRDV